MAGEILSAIAELSAKIGKCGTDIVMGKNCVDIDRISPRNTFSGHAPERRRMLKNGSSP